MTIIDLPRTAVEQPESQRLDVLLVALADPALIGFRREVLDAIEQLTGVRPELP